MTDCIINGESTPLVAGQSIFQHADQTEKAAYEIPSSCGRDGSCCECIVQILSGADGLSRRTPPERFLCSASPESAAVYRLACQACVADTSKPIVVETLRRSLRIVSEGRPAKGTLDPAVTRKGDRVLLDGQSIDAFRGKIYGLASIFMTVGIVGGPPLAGWAYDRLGFFDPVWLGLGVTNLVGIVLVLTAKRPERRPGKRMEENR